MHLKPSVVPPQVPVRYCAEEHWVLEQVVQVPFLVGDDPRRYWLALQTGWLAQAVLAVAVQLRTVYLPTPQVAHAAHALLDTDEQARIWNVPVAQAEHVLHLVFVVPEQSAEPNLPAAHELHALHW